MFASVEYAFSLLARYGQQAVAVEPLDVVALVGRAVAPDLDAVPEHRPHQQRAGDRAAQGRGVEVGAAARPDVEGAAGEGGEPLLHEGGLAVDKAGALGAVGGGPAGDRGHVGLVVLAQVGGVGVRHRALLAHPRDSHRRVQAAGEGDPDAFTDREGGEHLGHGCNYMHSSA
jgi:hypothetical protein